MGLLFLFDEEDIVEDKVYKPIAELLAYATVRLECILSNGAISTGTGFIMAFLENRDSNTSVPVIVTNKHVVRGSVSVRFVFTELIDGKASKTLLTFNLPVGEEKWFKHPSEDVDLCAMPIAPILNHVKSRGKSVAYTPLPMSIVATDEQLNDYLQLDEVVMIGYPDALWDSKNNQPIFRKGTIATNPSLEYNGTPNFLIDMPVFNGSSGSPIIAVREGVWYDRKTGRAHIISGPSCALLGVLHSGHVHMVDGKIVARPVPTTYVPVAQSSIPNNLGIVVKARELLVLEKAVGEWIGKHALVGVK